MTVIVNVAQYNSVPGIINSSAVAQIAGPLIVAANVSVDGSDQVQWDGAARFAVVTIITSGGIVYAASAAADSPALAVGAGQAVTGVQPILRRDSQAYLLLREHA